MLRRWLQINAPVFFLTSPNAPTGVAFSLTAIEAVLQRIDGILVVDEAYVDFGGETAVALLQDYENLVVVRTFSKSYALAGMRVGFGLASAGIIACWTECGMPTMWTEWRRLPRRPRLKILNTLSRNGRK